MRICQVSVCEGDAVDRYFISGSHTQNPAGTVAGESDFSIAINDQSHIRKRLGADFQGGSDRDRGDFISEGDGINAIHRQSTFRKCAVFHSGGILRSIKDRFTQRDLVIRIIFHILRRRDGEGFCFSRSAVDREITSGKGNYVVGVVFIGQRSLRDRGGRGLIGAGVGIFRNTEFTGKIVQRPFVAAHAGGTFFAGGVFIDRIGQIRRFSVGDGSTDTICNDFNVFRHDHVQKVAVSALLDSAVLVSFKDIVVIDITIPINNIEPFKSHSITLSCDICGVIIRIFPFDGIVLIRDFRMRKGGIAAAVNIGRSIIFAGIERVNEAGIAALGCCQHFRGDSQNGILFSIHQVVVAGSDRAADCDGIAAVDGVAFGIGSGEDHIFAIIFTGPGDIQANTGFRIAVDQTGDRIAGLSDGCIALTVNFGQVLRCNRQRRLVHHNILGADCGIGICDQIVCCSGSHIQHSAVGDCFVVELPFPAQFRNRAGKDRFAQIVFGGNNDIAQRLTIRDFANCDLCIEYKFDPGTVGIGSVVDFVQMQVAIAVCNRIGNGNTVEGRAADKGAGRGVVPRIRKGERHIFRRFAAGDRGIGGREFTVCRDCSGKGLGAAVQTQIMVRARKDSLIRAVVCDRSGSGSDRAGPADRTGKGEIASCIDLDSGGQFAGHRDRIGKGLIPARQNQIAVGTAEDILCFCAVISHIAEVFASGTECTADRNGAVVGEGTGCQIAIRIQRNAGVDRGGGGCNIARRRCRSGSGNGQIVVGTGDNGLTICAVVCHIAQLRTGAGVVCAGEGQRAVVGDHAAVKVTADFESAPMSVRFGDMSERNICPDRGIFSIDRTRHIQGSTIADDEIIGGNVTGNVVLILVEGGNVALRIAIC